MEFEISSARARAFDYIAERQLPDGCVTDTQENLILGIWDSVHALRAYASWRDRLNGAHEGVARRLLAFLRESETPEGLMSWGDREPGQYSTETSSEYVTALIHLGLEEEARPKARILRGAQLSSGPWRENHKHIPEVFQTMPSVTGFVLRVLWLLDMGPLYPEKALSFLLESQNEEGHWGYNWYYNAVPYYVTMPVTAALSRFNSFSPLRRARAYVLARQRDDGSFFFDMRKIMPDYEKQLSASVHTVYALETLLSSGLGLSDAPVRRGFSWLLQQQRPDGSFFGGNFPYPPSEQYRDFTTTQDVYGTAAVLVLLKRCADLLE